MGDLLREPHGFEGFQEVAHKPHSGQAPVPNLEHPAHRLFHVEPASPCAQLNAPEREHVIAEVSHVIEPKVEAFEALLYIREPLAHSLVPSVWLAC